MDLWSPQNGAQAESNLLLSSSEVLLNPKANSLDRNQHKQEM
jgi:hypothetical protein